jgi:primosomal protein N' (replication factor Y)
LPWKFRSGGTESRELKIMVSVLFPINAEAFSYSVPENIKSKITVGSLVSAPFKKQKKAGIITCMNSAHITGKEINLRAIDAVLDETQLVNESLLKLIEWVGQYYLSTSGLALKTAVPSGIFQQKRSGKSRIFYDELEKSAQQVNLNPEQNAALTEINSFTSGAFLLHGVTGSGKTEIYLRAIEAIEDREAIVLVPEIALTAQIIDRFRNRFGDKVAFFHSGISPGEKIAQWQKMRRGEVKVALGVRSAVFSPFKRLGLIIVDEEHEPSYKQFEGLRYSARDVALARAKIEGTKIILGSATPSLESFYNAQKGNIRYIELKHRIAKKPLPHVEIVDMTKEDTKTFSFSSRFLAALKETISKGYQSLILLNRRGYSPFLMCTDCGYTYKCPACSITLTYHKDTKTLNCHYCNSYIKPQEFCPRCNGSRTKHIGIGTQRVEEELHTLLPELSLRRMDRDTTKRKLSHYRMVKDMEAKKIDVLLGTQMVAKGHDFPLVTLSGVVLADVALNLPDFRSSERTFQLFTQLAGRAGRGEAPGEVYIQTYEPDHYVFDYVRNHDYKGFYNKEVELRKELSYPPFSRLTRIIFTFRTKDRIKKTMRDISMKKIRIQGVEILGPAPAPIEKIRNLWRWHIILKGKTAKSLRKNAVLILDAMKNVKDVRVDVDVDPINLL